MTASTGDDQRRDQRLEARLTVEEKELFERAAALTGRSTTGFVVSTVLDAARRIIRDHEAMALSARDREAVVAALLDPPAPNEALTRAAREYEENVDRRY